LEEQTQNNDQILPKADEEEISVDETAEPGGKNAVMYILPLLLCVFLFAGFTQEPLNKKSIKKNISQEQVIDEDENATEVNGKMI